MKLNKLKDTVMECLRRIPATRNSDRILYNEVCITLGYDTRNMSAWDMLHNNRMPSTESVRRTRQKAQAEFPELRATPAVQEQRRKLVEEYLDFARGF